MNKILVLDPDCRNQQSHNLQATHRACMAARAAGYDVDAVVNRVFPSSNTILDALCGQVWRTWPTFAFSAADDPKDPNVSSFHEVFDSDRPLWEKYYYGLLELHDQGAITNQTIVFIHTLSAPALMGILQFLLVLEGVQRPKFYCLIYCTEDIIQGAQLPGVSNLEVLTRLHEEGLIGTSVFFHVETRGLQAHYADLGFDFPMLMGPLDHLEDPVASASRHPTKRVISYLGEAREEKGFHKVPEIIEEVSRLNSGYEIEFRIQTYSNPSNATPATIDAVSRVEALKDGVIKIATLDALSKDDFNDELNKSDVMLLPYDADIYRMRGSGMVYDALMFDVRVVCTPDTDMHKTFANFGVRAPGTDTPADFAAEVVRVLESQDTPNLSDLDKYRIDEFFQTLIAAHPASQAPAPISASDTRCLLGLVLPVAGGHGFVEKAQIKLLSDLGVRSVLMGIPWVNGLDGLAYHRDVFIEYYFSSKETLGSPICFPDVIDDAKFRKVFSLYHHGHASVYAQSAFLRLISKHVACGPILELILKTNPVDTALLNYSWLAPLVAKIRAAQPKKPLRTLCEVHDYQSKQNIFRRLAYSERFDLDWSSEQIESDFDRETRIESHSLSEFDLNIYISDALRGQLGNPDHKGDLVIHPYNINLPQDIRSEDVTEAIGLSSDVVEYVRKHGKIHVDVLFVGTAHQANRGSLVFLLDEVMPEVRKENGPTSLFIVGNIDTMFSSLQKEEYAQEGSFFMGMVPDINAWYFVARVVALPVTEGTGFPTKVIETLSLGQCFSALDTAFYELAGKARDMFTIGKTAKGMATDIAGLLSSHDARVKRGADGRAFYDAYFSQANYVQLWSQALNIEAPELPEERYLAHFEVNHPFAEAFQTKVLKLTPEKIPLGQLKTGLLGDWSHPEGPYRWIDGHRGRIILSTSEPVLLTFVSIFARLADPVSVDDARISITVNDELFGHTDRVSHVVGHHTVENIGGILIEGVFDVVIECPQGKCTDADSRNLSTMFEYIQFGFVDPDTQDVQAGNHVQLRREYNIEGPYPELGLNRRFSWVGNGGVLLTRSDEQEIEGILRIEGFTNISDQKVEIRVNGEVHDQIPVTEDCNQNTEFAIEVPIRGENIEVAAATVMEFPPPDSRFAGLGIFEMFLDGEPIS